MAEIPLPENSSTFNVTVADPNGTLPGSIASLTVTGPNEFSYSFEPSDYFAADNEYFHLSSGAVQEGLYTFTVTDNEGKSAVTYKYHSHAGGTIPLLNEESFQISGNPLAPTVSWSAVAGYRYHPYYRVWIVDQQGNSLYYSPAPLSSNLSQTIPSGRLLPGISYKYRIDAQDDPYTATVITVRFPITLPSRSSMPPRFPPRAPSKPISPPIPGRPWPTPPTTSLRRGTRPGPGRFTSGPARTRPAAAAAPGPARSPRT